VALSEVLETKRKAILKRWREAILSTYPEDARRFLKREKNRFANPVGRRLIEEIEILYDALFPEADEEKIIRSLDDIIRIRAVQDFKPSEALSFVLDLKRIMREELGESLATNSSASEFEAIENRIDQTTLLAFDIYTHCRKTLHDIRLKEVQTHVGKLLKRANLVGEISGSDDPDL
jgi:hypothetical protein